MKAIYKSKTIQVAFIQVVVGILMFVSNQMEVGAALTLKSILDVTLRLATKEAVKIVEPKE